MFIETSRLVKLQQGVEYKVPMASPFQGERYLKDETEGGEAEKVAILDRSRLGVLRQNLLFIQEGGTPYPIVLEFPAKDELSLHERVHNRFKSLVLRGSRIAYEKGELGQQEWKELQEKFEKDGPRLTAYTIFWALSFAFSRAKNFPEAVLYTQSLKQLNLWPPSIDIDPQAFGLAFLVGAVSPAVFKFLTALGVGKIMKRDMSRAAVYGLFVTSELAVSAQVKHDLKEIGGACWHFSKRSLAADISWLVFMGHGGWGTTGEKKVANTAYQIRTKAETLVPKPLRKKTRNFINFLYDRIEYREPRAKPVVL